MTASPAFYTLTPHFFFKGQMMTLEEYDNWLNGCLEKTKDVKLTKAHLRVIRKKMVAIEKPAPFVPPSIPVPSEPYWRWKNL